jgi:superfamily I DNA/RNA helicase
MLDEAQDANPAILDILSHQNVQRIYVGDENQQIYGFGTINAMNTMRGCLPFNAVLSLWSRHCARSQQGFKGLKVQT